MTLCVGVGASISSVSGQGVIQTRTHVARASHQVKPPMDEQPLVSSPIVFFLAATVAIKPRRNVVETTLQAQTTRTAPVVVVGLRSVSRSAAPIVPPSETGRRKDAPHGWYRL